MLKVIRATVIVLMLGAGAPSASAPIPLEDFEAGVGAWTTSDGTVTGEGPARLCGIYTTGQSAPGGGQQAGMIEFLAGKDTWASVTIPIDGQQWLQNHCNRLALWLRGDSSDSRVDVVLRTSPDQPPNTAGAYRQSISLANEKWQKLGLRFLGFTDKDGYPLTQENIQHLTLLQFVKTGSWQPCRFYVDELRADFEAPAVSESGILEVDFGRSSGTVRIQLGCDFGAADNLTTASRARQDSLGKVIGGLAPCVVRLRLDDYLHRDSEQYDLARLNQHVNFVRHQGARALICLSAPRQRPGEEAETAQRLQQLFETTVSHLLGERAGASGGGYYELLDEPLLRPGLTTGSELARAYNSLAKQPGAPDPQTWLGGPGVAAPWGEHLYAFVQEAKHLGFLSYHFWGAHTPVVATSQLLAAARTGQAPDLPDQLSFAAVKALTKGRRAEIFITQAGVNSVAVSGEQLPSEHFTGSWLAMTALSAAPYVDKLLYAPLVGDQAGFMNTQGRPQAAYWSAWLLRTYMPRGSRLCHWLYPDIETVVGTIRTATANNVVLAYGGEAPRAFTIRAQGTGPLKLVRARKVDAAAQGIQLLDLPLSTEQIVELAGPGVMIVQFIP